MSDTSPRLGLPYLQPSQAQKHVTHNEALLRLDALVQLAVADFGETVPPASPAAGQIHALGASATAEWAGQDGKLALWDGTAWQFIDPQDGWRALGLAQGDLRLYSGGAWSPLKVSPDFSGETVLADRLGVGAAPDATNRLSVTSPATLLNNAGAGHQVKVNKAATEDTASLLFQTGWSGRAEMGLAGNDTFSVKVSADGSVFLEAIRACPETGIVSVPSGFDSVQFTVPFEGVTAVDTPTAGGFILVSMVDEFFPQNAASAIFVYDSGSSPALTTVWAGANISNQGSAELSGTTGPAGDLSVSSLGGQIQVENRWTAGGSISRQVAVTFLNGFRPL